MEEVAVVKKRGRPAKGTSGGAAPAAGISVDSSIPVIPKKRGRPPKVKGGRGRPPKLSAGAANSDDDDLDQDELGDANGELLQPLKIKGRGRPRKVPVQAQENSGNDDDDMDSSADEKPPAKQQKSPSSAKRRKLGRPRKHQPSEDDDGNYSNVLISKSSYIYTCVSKSSAHRI